MVSYRHSFKQVGYIVMAKNRFIITLFIVFSILQLTACQTNGALGANNANLAAGNHAVNLQGFPNNPEFFQGSTPVIWGNLQHVSLPQLNTAIQQTTNPNTLGWLSLAVISKQYSTNTTELINQLIIWRAANKDHPANALFPENSVLTSIQNKAPPKHIVLLLPLQGALRNSGQAVRDGFLNAYYETRSAKEQQTISFLDTSTSNDMIALYQQAIAQHADAVIGPLTKEQVQQLAALNNFPVPTVALNYTDVWFGSLPANFYEFGLSPLDETKQLAEKAHQTGHTRALLIAPNNEWGSRVGKTLTANWEALGGSMVDTFYFNEETDLNQGIANLLHVDPEKDATAMKKENNKQVLSEQRRHDFDVIFLLAPPESARQILPLLKYYYVEKTPVFSTSIIYSGTPAPEKDSDLNGVIFCDIPWTLQMAKSSGSKTDSRFDRLYAVGRDAYLLSSQITRLTELPNFPIYGATGALMLTPKQQIYRRLAWAEMRDGRP